MIDPSTALTSSLQMEKTFFITITILFQKTYYKKTECFPTNTKLHRLTTKHNQATWCLARSLADYVASFLHKKQRKSPDKRHVLSMFTW